MRVFREERTEFQQKASHTQKIKKILPCKLVFFFAPFPNTPPKFNHRDEEGGDEEQQQQTTRKNNNASFDVGSREGVLLLVANLFVALRNVHVV
jgi:hypothetical protein